MEITKGVGGELEKVKVTKEQAEALESACKKFSKEKIVKDHILDFYRNAYPLSQKGIETELLIKALYIGYEVEPVYTEGDWVVHLDSGKLGTIYLNEISEPDVDMGQEKDGLAFIRGKFRHATPEEIQQEKERRKWAGIGREVNEYKTGDIFFNEANCLFGEVIRAFDDHVVNQNDLGIAKKQIRLICPAEKRLDSNEQ